MTARCAGSAQRVLIVAVTIATACAHEARAPTRGEPVVWPASPERPRVRFSAILPPAGLRARGPSRWRRFLDAVLGVERAVPGGEVLARPFGLAAGSGGEVWVADPDGPLVARIDADPVVPVECKGRSWVAPMAIAVGPAGGLYVADAGAHEIVEVAPGGRCRAFGAEHLLRPTGIAAASDRLYVVDPPAHRVVVLSLSGKELLRIGARGDAAGQLNFPTAVALAPDGAVLVVDALNFRIARFTASGAWLGAFGVPGDERGAFARPKCLASDEAGRIYVSDSQRDVVLVFRGDGTFDYSVGATGDAPGRFTAPAGVAVSGDRLYVADSFNHRVQVFEILGGSS